MSTVIVIRDELCIPPSWFSSFRDFTLHVSVFLKADIVVESDEVDLYYHWLKPRGGMDFVSDIVRTGSENGLRIDTIVRPGVYSGRLIRVPRIAPENIHRLIGAVRVAA